MCQFITAVLDDTAHIAELEAIARKHGRQFRPLTNPHIERQLQTGQRYFLTTTKACDCDTALGDRSRRLSQANDHEVERRRLARKGWSAAKIERSLAQQEESAAASMRKSELSNANEYMAWISLINEVLESRQTREIGLLLHHYDGPLDAAFPLQGKQRVPMGNLDASLLGAMCEDVLYLFHR